MNKDDSHAVRLLSCVKSPRSDLLLPHHPSTSDVLSNHWKQSEALYQKLVQTFGIPKQLPTLDIDPDSEYFMEQTQQSKRSLLWIPSGLVLFNHLVRFFHAQGMEIYTTHPLFSSLRALPQSQATWITYRHQLYRSPEACEASFVSESGIYPRITPSLIPSAVQIVSFIAIHHVLGTDADLSFKSPSPQSLRFLRTSTTILDEIAHVGVAFIPKHGIYLDAYILDEEAHLHTADLFVLPNA